MNLTDVAIGQPARITVKSLIVGADVRALLSRRIEHAEIHVNGARVELPLPPFAFLAAPADPSASSSGAPVEIVSIDTVDLNDVELVSGGRTLRGSVSVVPRGRGAEVRRIALQADGSSLEMTGAITDLAGPAGELTVTATGLNVLDVLAFVQDFARGTGLASRRGSAPPASPMDIALSIRADRALVGPLQLDEISTRARLTNATVTLDPLRFAVFGGTVAGVVVSALDGTPGFHLKASLASLDTKALAAFAGAENTITGRLSGALDLASRGDTVDAIVKAAKGTARVTVADGTVAGLGLVRTVVVATSMRDGSREAARASRSDAPEPFSSLSASLMIAGGRATTDDLEFVSPDVHLTGAGGLDLAALAVDVGGKVQLSDALSQQAGRDLVRYTRENGRVTLPVLVTGTPGQFRVTLDADEIAKRAISNRASEELKKVLGRIIKK
jgi:hypothetical protein